MKQGDLEPKGGRKNGREGITSRMHFTRWIVVWGGEVKRGVRVTQTVLTWETAWCGWHSWDGETGWGKPQQKVSDDELWASQNKASINFSQSTQKSILFTVGPSTITIKSWMLWGVWYTLEFCPHALVFISIKTRHTKSQQQEQGQIKASLLGPSQPSSVRALISSFLLTIQIPKV